jgi:adenosylmethionine-8-amino-7-oxononanoate aminotransferase
MTPEQAVSPLWNPFANTASLAGQTITMVRGEGCWVVDGQGRRYLDALASLRTPTTG